MLTRSFVPQNLTQTSRAYILARYWVEGVHVFFLRLVEGWARDGQLCRRDGQVWQRYKRRHL